MFEDGSKEACDADGVKPRTLTPEADFHSVHECAPKPQHSSVLS
jgi:hypothetical protein